jgi:signal peptidase I
MRFRPRRLVVVVVLAIAVGLGRLRLCGDEHGAGELGRRRLRSDQRLHRQQHRVHARLDHADEPQPGELHDRADRGDHRQGAARRRGLVVQLHQHRRQRDVRHDLAAGDGRRGHAAHGRRDPVARMNAIGSIPVRRPRTRVPTASPARLRARRWLRPPGGAALTSAVVAATWWLLAPPALGGSTSFVSVDGTSMVPRLRRDDLVALRPAHTYRVGDVVAYRSTLMGRVVLHRIVGVHGGRFTFKGDNNSFLDPDQPTRSELVGRLWFQPARRAARPGIARAVGRRDVRGAARGRRRAGRRVRPRRGRGRASHLSRARPA